MCTTLSREYRTHLSTLFETMSSKLGRRKQHNLDDYRNYKEDRSPITFGGTKKMCGVLQPQSRYKSYIS